MFGVMHHNNVPDDRHIKVRMLISIRPWAVHGTIGWMDAIPGRPLLPPLEEMDRAAPLRSTGQPPQRMGPQGKRPTGPPLVKEQERRAATIVRRLSK